MNTDIGTYVFVVHQNPDVVRRIAQAAAEGEFLRDDAPVFFFPTRESFDDWIATLQAMADIHFGK